MMLVAIAEHPHNFWLILGGLLLALEMLGASGFLLWSGIAALLVGLLTWLVPLGWEWQGATFAVLTVGSAWLWWYRLRAADSGRPASTLNQRGQQLIGLRTRLSEPVSNGFGRLRVGDSTWRVQADEDLPAGTWVEVYATEGITLRVRRTVQE
ncbi:NfeD family protein [Candidatus Sodalis sp. SoCistrobi]|uniref:NfeD family protein n=1 Tax=Candidatus Sodalis sp. SoCistrobi TaxID=1922216 RepID=UPI00093D569F|nr:NfeD family protein [Candidatus Sodalis sp. SoCistrobi]